jgi:hypothetical protein
MRDWLRRHVFNNAGIKLASLALAIILYLHVFARQEREMVFDVSLILRGVPEGLTWSGELAPTAQVRFRGVGVDLMKLRTRIREARLEVDVSEARPGLYQRPLVSEDVHLPGETWVQVVGIDSPKEISLAFDNLLVRRLGVSPRVAGRAAPGFIRHGAVLVDPESVLVRGAETTLRSFEYLKTATVDITGADAIVTRRAAVLQPPKCEVTPSEVTVRVMFERVVSRTFAELPVEVLRSGDVKRRRLEPETGMVVVSGPTSLVESLRPEDLRLSIDARDFPPGTYTLILSVRRRKPAASSGTARNCVA